MSRKDSDGIPTWLLSCVFLALIATAVFPGLALEAFGRWIIDTVEALK